MRLSYLFGPRSHSFDIPFIILKHTAYESLQFFLQIMIVNSVLFVLHFMHRILGHRVCELHDGSVHRFRVDSTALCQSVCIAHSRHEFDPQLGLGGPDESNMSIRTLGFLMQ